MRFNELILEGPIDSLKKNWNKGANAAHKLATPSRWAEPAGTVVDPAAQKKSPTSTLGITRANKADALAILNSVDTSKLSPSQQQLLDTIKTKVEKI
jgi:hypothetical protein